MLIPWRVSFLMLFAQMGFISMALLVHFSGCGPPTSTHLLQFILLMEEILHQLRLVVYLILDIPGQISSINSVHLFVFRCLLYLFFCSKEIQVYTWVVSNLLASVRG